MKKFLTILLIALILPVSCILKAEELKQSPTQAVFMGSGWNDNSFSESMDFGLKAGLQTALDEDKGIWIRVLYSQWQLRPSQTTQAFTTSILTDWYVGKKWTYYMDFGGESYVDGPLTGTDLFAGMGVTRRIWTDSRPGYDIPAHVDLFGEIKFADGSGQVTGSYVQLNVGVKFGRNVALQ